MNVRPSSLLVAKLDIRPPQPWRKPNSFHASSLLDCGRRKMLGLMGVEEKKIVKPEWERTADIGNLVHDYIQHRCADEKILEACEQPLPENEYLIGGRVDAIIVLDGVRYVLEIKSMDVKKYDRFQPYPRYDKFLSAYTQLQFYLWALQIERGLLVGFNRDNCRWKEFTVWPDYDLVQRLLTRYARLRDMYEFGVLPESERGSNCTFCGYKDTEYCSTGDW